MLYLPNLLSSKRYVREPEIFAGIQHANIFSPTYNLGDTFQ